MKRWLAGIAWIFLAGGTLPLVQAQDEPVPEVINRYQQMLERSPGEGSAFDKVTQYFQEHGGLPALDAWWAAKGAENGGKDKAIYTLLRGFLADRRNLTEEAGKFLEEATRLAPENFRAWLAWGDFLAKQGKLQSATESYQKALTLEIPAQERAAVFRKLGSSQQRNMDAEGAKATWLKMAAEFPKDSFALDEAASALAEAEQFEEAGKIYQQLVDATEANSMGRVQALMKVSELRDRQGKTKEAIQGYETILPQTSTGSWLNREIRGRIEQIYRRQDDLAGLIKYYQDWLGPNPKDVEATLRLSTAFGELDRKPEALDTLKKAVAMAPDRRDIQALLARGLVDAKQYDEAIRILTALTAADPEDSRYWIWLGESHWLKNDPPTPENKTAALASWKNMAPDTVKNVGPVLQLAELLQGYGLTDEAVAEYQRALNLAPDAPEVRLRFVEYLRFLKREDEAGKVLQGMVEGDRATPANYLRLASTYRRLEKPAEARAMVDHGLELEPANFDLLNLSWNLYGEEKKWPEALALFDKMTAAAPNVYFVEQIEIRHLQALASAEQIDATVKALRARLKGEPPLSEGELRLLARLDLQQNNPEDFEKAMAVAREKFPKSSSLLRLDAEQKRKTGDLDGAVLALQKLVETAPAQKNDWLTDLARVRMEQGQTEEALKVVQQMIDANPAQSSGYLLYADLALAGQKQELAIEKLKQAIKASENGNDIRLRLARLYSERGELQAARETYEAAFEAVESPQDRLALIKPMAEAYFLEGKLDDLITRFKQRQAAEEGGWRYGLYLAEMYQQLQDFGGARRELAKSLVQRPNDPALLKQLVALAEKENDPTELIKYREQLAAIDSSPAIQIALADTYNNAGRYEDAWTVLQKNAGPLGKDPQAWRTVLKGFAGTDFKEKVQRLLEDSLAQQGDELQAQLTLAEFWMGQGETAPASKILWNMVGKPLPIANIAPVPVPATPAPRGRLSALGSWSTNDYSRRSMRSYEYLNDGQQLLAGSAVGRRSSRYGYMPQVTTVRAANSQSDLRDRALVYLAAIAVKENKTEAFVEQLDSKLKEGDWTGVDRIVAYALVQAREPLWTALQEVAKDQNSTQDMDLFAYSTLFNFVVGSQTDEEKKKQVSEMRSILAERLVKRDPDLAPSLALNGVQLAMYAGSGVTDRAQILKLVDQVLEKMDRNDPEQLMSGLQLVLANKNYDRVEEILGLLEKQDLKKAPLNVQQQLQWLPNYLTSVRVPGTGDAETKKEQARVPEILVRLMRLRYPAVPPTSFTAGTTGYRSNAYYGDGQFPPANRFINENMRQSLLGIFQNLKANGRVDDLLVALDKEQKATTDWKKIYPTLTLIYMQWWNGKKDEAITATRELLKSNPADDFHLLLASMLTQQQKYEEAIRELDLITVRYGPDYVATQQQLLRTAKLGKDMETAKKAALRLVALRLPAQDRSALIAELRELGLKEKAEELGKQVIQMSGRSSGNTYDADRQLFELLQKYTGDKESEKVISLARQILGRDPMVTDQGMGESLRRQALESLKQTNQLKPYLESLKSDIDKTPDSMRLNLAMAEAIVLDEDKAWLRHRAEYPLWLKLKREGSQFTASWSGDGKEWQEVGKTTLDLPGQVYIGMALSNANGPESAVAQWQQIGIQGKITGDWKGMELGANQGVAGSYSEEKDGIRIVSTKGDLWGKQDSAYFVYKSLQGDGEIQGQVLGIQNLSGKGEAVDWAKAALIIRANLEPGSGEVFVAATPSRGIALQQRIPSPSPDRDSETVAAISTFQLPLWMKIRRNGNDISLSQSRDGKEWREVRKFLVAFGDEPIYAGVIVGTNRNGETVKAVWEDLKVSPESTLENEEQRSAGVPAPWRIRDLREGTAAGSSVFENNQFVLKAPEDAGKSGLMHYLYQPLPKEGEVTGRLVKLEASATAGWTSLALFKALEPLPTHVQLTFTSKQDLVAEYNVDVKTIALPYWRKAAALAPRDVSLQMKLARFLQSREANDEALRIYSKMLEQNFGTAVEQQGFELLQAYDKAGRLDDFFKYMDAWAIPPFNPMTGSSNLSYIFLSLGEQLEQRGDAMSSYALRLYKKGRENDIIRNSQLDSKIVGLLRKMNQNEEAARETLGYFDGNVKEAPKAVLGLQTVNYSQQGLRVSFGSDGTIYCEELDMLSHAQELGVFGQVKEVFEKKLAKNPNDFEVLSRLALLEVMNKDKGYEAHVKTMQTLSLQMFYQNGICGVFVQELARWPEQRSSALKLALEMKKNSSSSPYQEQFVNWQIVRMPWAADDAASKVAVTAALREISASLVEQSTQINRMDASAVLRCLNYMLSLGMGDDSQKLVDQIQDTQEFKTNSSLKRQLDQFREEIGFRKGVVQNAGLTFRIDTGVGKEGTDLIEWEVASKQMPGTVRMLASKFKAAGMEVAILAGSGNSEMTTVKVIPNPELHGSVQLKLPAGTQWVSVILRKQGSKEARDGMVQAVGRGPNLIRNPNMATTGTAGQPPKIEGWQGVFPFAVASEKTGPWSKMGAFSVRSGRNGMKEIFGEPVPVKEGTVLVQGFWVRSEGNYQMGRRYLDAKGNELKKSYSNSNSGNYSRSVWGGAQQVLSFTPIDGRSYDLIPAGTVSVQPVFQINGSCDFAGLSLQTMEPAAPSEKKPETPPAAKK